MSYIVTRTTTDLISGTQKGSRRVFADELEAMNYMEELHGDMLERKGVTLDKYLNYGDGYLIEFFPKMQCVIELSEVG